MTEPTVDEADRAAQALATESLAGGDPTAWFERLYAAAAEGAAVVPWDRHGPNPALAGRLEHMQARAGESAVVVGCGLGDDAELVASRGFRTVAFDVSHTAVELARRRWPHSSVAYLVADLLDLPLPLVGGFELVVESMTVQSMPRPFRTEAIAGVRRLVSPSGLLLVLAFGSDDDARAWSGPPWPLTRADVDAFATDGLVPVDVEFVPDPVAPALGRWLAEFRRATGSRGRR